MELQQYFPSISSMVLHLMKYNSLNGIAYIKTMLTPTFDKLFIRVEQLIEPNWDPNLSDTRFFLSDNEDRWTGVYLQQDCMGCNGETMLRFVKLSTVLVIEAYMYIWTPHWWDTLLVCEINRSFLSLSSWHAVDKICLLSQLALLMQIYDQVTMLQSTTWQDIL